LRADCWVVEERSQLLLLQGGAAPDLGPEVGPRGVELVGQFLEPGQEASDAGPEVARTMGAGRLAVGGIDVVEVDHPVVLAVEDADDAVAGGVVAEVARLARLAEGADESRGEAGGRRRAEEPLDQPHAVRPRDRRRAGSDEE